MPHPLGPTMETNAPDSIVRSIAVERDNVAGTRLVAMAYLDETDRLAAMAAGGPRRVADRASSRQRAGECVVDGTD